MILAALLFGLTAIWMIRKRKSNFGKALIVLIAVAGMAGLAWAATIVLDGQVNDWAGITAHPDAVDDSSIGDPNEDIWAGFVTSDNAYFYFRMDMSPQQPE